MWPGIVTAGLFSFLLAYNDFIISSQLMNGDMATMTAALGNYMGQKQSVTRLMHGIAGAVSVTIPIIILVYAFQRHIVSGLTAGATKDDRGEGRIAVRPLERGIEVRRAQLPEIGKRARYSSAEKRRRLRGESGK